MMERGEVLKILLFLLALIAALGGLIIFALGMKEVDITIIIAGPAISFAGFMTISLLIS